MTSKLVSWGIAAVAAGLFFWRKNAGVKGCTDIEAKELNTLIEQKKDIKIIDVRTPAEFSRGHIANALSRPLGEINDWMNEFTKHESLVMVCASGMRSKDAARRLVEHGYNNISNLKGGMSTWHYEVKK